MNGPEHLAEGKRLLAECATIGEATPAGQATATVAAGHLLAAQVCAYAASQLPEWISWQEASNA